MIAIDIILILTVAGVWLLRADSRHRTWVVGGAIIAMLIPIAHAAFQLGSLETRVGVRVEGVVVAPLEDSSGVLIGAGCTGADITLRVSTSDPLAEWCLRARRRSDSTIMLSGFDNVTAIERRASNSLLPFALWRDDTWEPLRGAYLSFESPVVLPSGDSLRLVAGGRRGSLMIRGSASQLSTESRVTDRRSFSRLSQGSRLCDLDWSGARPDCGAGTIVLRHAGPAMFGRALPLRPPGGPRYLLESDGYDPRATDSVVVNVGDTLRVVSRGSAWEFAVELRAPDVYSPATVGIVVRFVEPWRRTMVAMPPSGAAPFADRLLPAPEPVFHAAFGRGLDTSRTSILGRIERRGDSAVVLVDRLPYAVRSGNTLVPVSVDAGVYRSAGLLVAAHALDASSATRFFLHSAILLALTFCGGLLAIGQRVKIDAMPGLVALAWLALLVWRVILGARLASAAPFSERSVVAAPAGWIAVVVMVVLCSRLDMLRAGSAWVRGEITGRRAAPRAVAISRRDQVRLCVMACALAALALLQFSSTVAGVALALIGFCSIVAMRAMIGLGTEASASTLAGLMTRGLQVPDRIATRSVAASLLHVLTPVGTTAAMLSAARWPQLFMLVAIVGLAASWAVRRERRGGLRITAAVLLGIGIAAGIGSGPLLMFALAIVGLLLIIRTGLLVRHLLANEVRPGQVVLAGDVGHATVRQRARQWGLQMLPFMTAAAVLISFALVDMGLVLCTAPALMVAAMLSVGSRNVGWPARLTLAGLCAGALLVGRPLLAPDTSVMRDQTLPLTIRAHAFASAGGAPAAVLRRLGFGTAVDRMIVRSIAVQDPETLERIMPLLPPSLASDAIVPTLAHVHGMLRAVDVNAFGNGLGLGTAIDRGVPAPVLAAENVFGGVLVNELGVLGGVAGALPYLVLVLAVGFWLVKNRRNHDEIAVAEKALVASASVWVVFQSLYVAASNLSTVTLTGQNMLGLNAASYGDALLVAAMTGFTLVPMLQSDLTTEA